MVAKKGFGIDHGLKRKSIIGLAFNIKIPSGENSNLNTEVIVPSTLPNNLLSKIHEQYYVDALTLSEVARCRVSNG